jgi:hypothetical protein
MPIHLLKTESIDVEVEVESVEFHGDTADVTFSITTPGYAASACPLITGTITWIYGVEEAITLVERFVCEGWQAGDYDQPEAATFTKLVECHTKEHQGERVSNVEAAIADSPLSSIGIIDEEENEFIRRKRSVKRIRIAYSDLALIHFSNTLNSNPVLSLLTLKKEDQKKPKKDLEKPVEDQFKWVDKSIEKLQKYAQEAVKKDKQTAEYKEILKGLDSVTKSVRELTKKIELLVKAIECLPLAIRKEIDAAFDDFIRIGIQDKVSSVDYAIPDNAKTHSLKESTITVLLNTGKDLASGILRLDDYGLACYPQSIATTIAALTCYELISLNDEDFRSTYYRLCDEGIARFSQMIDPIVEGSFKYALDQSDKKMQEAESALGILGLTPGGSTEYFLGWSFNLYQNGTPTRSYKSGGKYEDPTIIEGTPSLFRWSAYAFSANAIGIDWSWNGMRPPRLLAHEPEVYSGPVGKAPIYNGPSSLASNYGLPISPYLSPSPGLGFVPATALYEQQATTQILKRLQARTAISSINEHFVYIGFFIEILKEKRKQFD